MIALFDAAQALKLDAEVERTWALESGTLMESAAQRLAGALMGLIGPPSEWTSRRIVVAAGSGNNGGDALALLRNLAFAGYPNLAALLVDREPKPLPARHIASLISGGVPVSRWNSVEGRRALIETDLLIDGIAGTGLSGPLVGDAADYVVAINDSCKEVIAIDLPSGFRDEAGADEPRIKAAVTLSIEPRKLCLYAPSLRPQAGRIIGVEGVFPVPSTLRRESLDPSSTLPIAPSLLSSTDIPDLLIQPSEWSHKGDRGRLAVFAGSSGMVGAALLAARAAQASGAGLVTLFVRDELFEALRAVSPESVGGAIIRPESAFQEGLSRQDAVLAGPGWGRDPSRNPLLSTLLDTQLPLVLDADAVRILPELAPRERKAPLVLTPHPGEFESLSGKPAASILASPRRILTDIARDRGASIALKTATTWLMAPDGTLRVIDGGEAGLAVAGSGDVLAGLVAGLIARKAGGEGPTTNDVAFRALCLASLVHLEAGRALRKEEGWFEASRIVSKAAVLLGRPMEIHSFNPRIP
ncbi:MAG TPA: NAD(P)H-hydrate dehydratase [Rectinemataceae bacterium]|nr:NAD(P)H-hydrate dehydratase [Rectinemataceae bacterium]